MRKRAILVAATALLTGVPLALATDPLDPTGETVVIYLESVPEGAVIEFRGIPQKVETNAFVSFEVDYVRTIRIVLEGYEPCTATQDRLPRDPKTGDLIFTCKLRRIVHRAPIEDWLPQKDGPSGPLAPTGG